MDSALFSLAKCLRKNLRSSLQSRNPSSLLHSSTSHSTSKEPTRPTLQSALWPLGHPTICLTPVIERWIDNGNFVRTSELQLVIRELRKRRRFKQALEVSEWMKDKSKIEFKPGDHAVQLDLIGTVHGLSSAEEYFNSLSQENRTEKSYGALLNCYVKSKLVDKALAHFEKMKELNLALSPLQYNDIMCLYTNTGQHEKVPSVLTDMQENGVLPDNYSYRICINSYGFKSDIYGMEKLLEEMEQQPNFVVDWNTYAVVANIYIKSNHSDKSLLFLKKSEEKIDKKDGPAYNHLLSLYGQLGTKSELWRLWGLQKENCKKLINRDYTTMISSLVKMSAFEEAEILIKEWDSSPNSLDFRVVNVLLNGFRSNGLLDKTEEMLNGFLERGKTPPSSSWGIIASGYAQKGDIKKAYELMKNALCVYKPYLGWRPNNEIIKRILGYLGERCELEELESFVELLKVGRKMDREMYHALIRARIRGERKVDDLLKGMRNDGIRENKETREILSSIGEKKEDVVSL